METKEISLILRQKSGDLEGINIHMLDLISQCHFTKLDFMCIQYFTSLLLVNLCKYLHIGLTSVLTLHKCFIFIQNVTQHKKYHSETMWLSLRDSSQGLC